MVGGSKDASKEETGWSIGEKGSADASNDAASLYSKLEEIIVPMFYRERDRFIDIMLHCIALNGSSLILIEWFSNMF